MKALKARFPSIRGPKRDDICYATQNRQDAVKFMAPQCDVVVVVGSPNSSNSNRLREVARNFGRDAYLVDKADEIDPAWIAGKRTIGVTAGASAPEVLVQEVILRLQALGAQRVSSRLAHIRPYRPGNGGCGRGPCRPDHARGRTRCRCRDRRARAPGGAGADRYRPDQARAP